MTRLIKAADVGSIVHHSPVSAGRAREENQHQAALRQLAERLAAVEEELEKSQEREQELREETRKEYARGKIQGFDAGLAQVVELQERRLALLEDALQAAVANIGATIGKAEELGALLAHDCLSILFGDESERTQVVADLIRRQVALLDPSSVIRVSVSQVDFSEPVTLEELAHRVGISVANIAVAPQMQSGDARIQLALGENDIGLGQQWGRLAQALVDSASGGK